MSLPFAWIALVTPFLLASCQDAEPTEIQETSPISAPIDRPGVSITAEEAEPYVVELLDRYLSTTDLITTEGGSNPSRIRDLVSDTWWREEEEGFLVYQARGERTLGETTMDSVLVQSVDETAGGMLDISTFACVDSSEVFVLGRDAPEPPEEVWAWHPHYDDFAGTEEERAVIDQYFADADVRFGQRQPVVFWLTGPTLDTLVIDSSEQWWGAHPC